MTGTGAVKSATLFTAETANRALPYVRAVVEDLVDAVARLRRAEESKAKAAGRPADERARLVREADDARRAAREDLERLVGELDRVGVEVKDPAVGLLDFPGEIDGRRVCLCWKRGEESVAWWHDLESGFQGRRPLPPAPVAGGGAAV